MTEEFNDWWNGDTMPPNNPYAKDSPAFWAWAGWQMAEQRNQLKATIDEVRKWTDERAAIVDGWRQCAKGQKTTQFCGMVEGAIKIEREACVVECHKLVFAEHSSGSVRLGDMGWTEKCAAAIRKRGEQ